jgi:phosphate-selective porin OprO and OprP
MKLSNTSLTIVTALTIASGALAQPTPIENAPGVAPTQPASDERVAPAPTDPESADAAPQAPRPAESAADPAVTAPTTTELTSPSEPASPPNERAAGATEEGAPATPPQALAVGKGEGLFQPGALLQFWTTYSHQSETPDTFAFRLRRAELKIKGEIVPKRVSYNVMLDAAKYPKFRSVDVTDEVSGATIAVTQPDGSDQSMLQDFTITFLSDYADVSLGQFKIPVSLEGLTSSSKLLFPERADVARAFGDKRDLGIKVEKALGDHFYYYAGVFNGTGINTAEVDNDKNAGLRLELYPIKSLTIGLVGFATVGARDNRTTDRIEGDLRYDAGGFIAQAEYIRAWDANGGGATEGHGTYLALGYTLDKFQPVARVGFLDANVDTPDNSATKYEAGLNYFIQGQEARLALAAAFTDAEDADVPLKTDVTFAAQVSF